jgi:hypothetical protein
MIVFFVYAGTQHIAEVNAPSSSEAVRIACAMHGHDPAQCHAVTIETGIETGVRITTGVTTPTRRK